jgi:tRNA modification GTPase
LAEEIFGHNTWLGLGTLKATLGEQRRFGQGSIAVSARDTIFALSSGPPPAGVAVVRISGERARSGLEALVGPVPQPRRASLRVIKGLNGEALDRGLVLFFPAPASATGEDVAELHLHGGRAVVGALLDRLGRIEGFRPAEAGEFTRRAFLNRKLDLAQVEGLADLVAAETEAQRRQALRQWEGRLSELYEGWRARLVRARALVEAGLDFAEDEDVPGAVGREVWDDVTAVAREIAAHLDDAHRGERLRAGAEIVVLGPPNAGKSSLINALARRDVAIVAEEPGTTRDLIEIHLDLGGYPATLVDTAGMREAAGLVEAEGIRRAEVRAAGADLVLALSDMTGEKFAPAAGTGAPVLRVGTKLDLIDTEEEQTRQKAAFDVVVSSRTGEGLGALCDRLTAFLAEELSPGESPLITRARHRKALEACREALEAVGAGAGDDEIRAEELRRATDALGRITGRVDVEDLLDVIFREFCIGK